ncbi:MAG: succinylglutamate desuccinylase [Verrucomicrobia bacterium]|nr:MAG: succinylglutamate desuccinylase [Verrucomicrobiota bacterium]
MSDSQSSNDKALSALASIQRLGKNFNGYFGERIDITAVLADCLAAAHWHGWISEQVPAGKDLYLSILKRPAGAAERARIYISAGIHGDEPAGPLAMRQLLQEDRWLPDVSFWLCPCLNPAGLALGRRENADGLDLNRQYLNPRAAETLAHIAWLQKQPDFHLCLCLHEDWEANGFYIYELNPDSGPSVAEKIISSVAAVCPIEQAEVIEGRTAVNGIIRPSLDPRLRPEWPESFYLITNKTRHSCTLEAPSDFALSARVAALVEAVKAALAASVH